MPLDKEYDSRTRPTMNARYREELTRLGWPLPAVYRYTVRCRWRPPKDHWPSLGPNWREVTVVLDCTGSPEHAACDACLHLIAVRRGQAKAVAVSGGKAETEQPLSHIHFNWSWYSGVVTWGGWVVEVH